MPVLIVEPTITSKNLKYSDLSINLKNHSGKSIHDLVQALKDEGITQEINGDNISSFAQKAKGEVDEANAKLIAIE